MHHTHPKRNTAPAQTPLPNELAPQERRQWVKEIVTRMMQAWGFKNKRQLADELSLNAKAPSNWIQNGAVPWQAICICSSKTGRSLDWLYYGKMPELQLSDAVKQQFRQHIEMFLHLSCKAKQINEANSNGLATLADGLSDEIAAFLSQQKDLVQLR